MQVIRNLQHAGSEPFLALVFSAEQGGHGRLTEVTRHHVKDGVLSVGELVSTDAIRGLLAELTDSADTLSSQKNGLQLIPANVLIDNADRVVWYQPSRVAMLWLQKGSKRRGMQIKWPALLFRVEKSPIKFSIVALDEDARPSCDSPVYDVPMPNCYHGGGFCHGTAYLPTTVTTGTLVDFENCLYESLKTHSNNRQAVSDGSDVSDFWVKQSNSLTVGELPSIRPEQMTKLGTLEQWLSR